MPPLRSPRRLAFAGAALVAVATALKTPVLSPDSSSYIDGSLMRPPLIPLLFVVLRAALGGAAARGFFVVQTALAIASCVALSRALAKHVGLAQTTTWLIGGVLAIPQLRESTSIASESLAYSFLCFAVACAIPLLWGMRSRRHLLLLVASCAALVATRGQFIYLPPLCALATLAFAWREPSWRERARTLAGAACIPVLVLLLQAAHTYPKVHRFARVAVTGLQTMTLTTCLATDAEVASIEDPATRAFAERVRADVRADGGLMEQHGEIAPPFFLGDHYNPILSRIYDEYFEGVAHLPHVAPQDRMGVPAPVWVEMDTMTLAASRGIARHAWKRIALFCISSIFLWERYVAILALAMLGAGVLHYRRAPGPARLLLTIAALWWANICLVAALEPPQSRYTFYFDELVVVVVLALVSRALGAAFASGTGGPEPSNEST